VITQVISDHSPCTTDLKLLEDGDFLKVFAMCFGGPLLKMKDHI
jgi:hypothetical protein